MPAVEPKDIVICGRRTPDRRHRLPLPIARRADEPVPGGPPAMVWGCLRLCEQPVRIDIIGGNRRVIRAIGRAIDRLLHPD